MTGQRGKSSLASFQCFYVLYGFLVSKFRMYHYHISKSWPFVVSMVAEYASLTVSDPLDSFHAVLRALRADIQLETEQL